MDEKSYVENKKKMNKSFRLRTLNKKKIPIPLCRAVYEITSIIPPSLAQM